MVLGGIITKNIEAEINNHHPEAAIEVENIGDRPTRMGSYFYFYEANVASDFEREMAHGEHLDILAGVVVRSEPGNKKEAQLVEYAGKRKIFGLRSMVNGPIDESRVYRPIDENDEYAGVFGDDSAEDVNKEGGKRS